MSFRMFSWQYSRGMAVIEDLHIAENILRPWAPGPDRLQALKSVRL